MTPFDHGQSTSWIILMTVILTVSAQRNSILTPPKDVTGKLGDSVKLHCEVEFSDMPTMKWEFNNNIVYLLHYDQEHYPEGKGKYSVVQDGRNFTLLVRDLQYGDGGKYLCRLLDQAEDASLIITGNPHLFTTATSFVEGNTEEVICTVQFGGPRKEDISPEQYPQLGMFLDHEVLNGTITEQILEGPASRYNITQTQNLTLESSMHGMILLCEIRTSDPIIQLNITLLLEVLYPVRNISYTPYKTQYQIGDVINCSAEGYPKPEVQWEDLKTGNLTQGQSLKVTKEMVGSNTWNCTARNNVSGHLHEDSVKAAFAVLPTASGTSPSTGNYWKIAVVATIGFCLAIAGLIALAYYARHYKKQKYLPVKLKGEAESYKRLVNIIGLLEQEEDLTEREAERMQASMPKEFPTDVDKPSALIQYVNKSLILMGSPHYFTLLEMMVSIYKSSRIQEDPLLALVELLEKKPCITQNQDKLIRLFQLCLRDLTHSAVTRSRCMRVLITNTREWKICKGEAVQNEAEQLRWKEDFVKILKDLLNDETDPAWSPEGSHEGSNLHVFMAVVPQVLIAKPDRFEALQELLTMMMTESAVACENVDGEGKTVLHVLVAGIKGSSFPALAHELLPLISCLIIKNDALKDSKDKLNNAPLHSFLTGVLLEDNGHQSEKLLKFVTDITLLLISCTNINLQNDKGETALHLFICKGSAWTDNPKAFLKVVNCLKSSDNINFKNDEGATALHIFTSMAGKWRHNTNEFLEVVQCLQSPTNIDIKTNLSETALHIFTSKAGEWNNHPETFLKVIDKYLTSDTNINIENNEGATALHIFATYVDVWKDCPAEFLEVIAFLTTKSPTSKDIQDSRGDTALHFLFFSLISWRDKYDMLVKRTNTYSSDREVDLKIKNRRQASLTFCLKAKHGDVSEQVLNDIRKYFNETKVNRSKDGELELQISVSGRGRWAEQHNIFLKLVKCLASSENINVQNHDGETALHCLARCESKWADHPDISKIVKLLMSSENLFMKNVDEKTAVDLFQQNWGECAKVILDVASQVLIPACDLFYL